MLAASAAAADPKLLPPEQAFRFSARALDARTLEARFTVADGYYLYRDKIKFAVAPMRPRWPRSELPPGKLKEDQFFGKVETYRGVGGRQAAARQRGGRAVDRPVGRLPGLRGCRRLLSRPPGRRSR